MTSELGSDLGPERVETAVIGAGQAGLATGYHLPGMRFPAPLASYPTKDQMADFLETYASTFELPVRTGMRVTRVTGEDGRYLVATGESSFRCDSLVVASGMFGRTPYVPGLPPSWTPASPSCTPAPTSTWPCSSAAGSVALRRRHRLRAGTAGGRCGPGRRPVRTWEEAPFGLELGFASGSTAGSPSGSSASPRTF